MAISQLVRFLLPSSQASATAFKELRRRVESTGLASNQYSGYVLENVGYPRPKPANQMCWYIGFVEWSEQSAYRTSHAFMQQLGAIAEDKPKSLIFNFKETKSGEILKGLESKNCEFAIINLALNAPRFDNEFENAMHKTFTDCYFAKGFNGGGWGYALNSNESEGKEITTDITEDSLLDEKEKKLAFYLLGWDSIAEHDEYEKSELFDVEINKLKPYFGPGTGAFYVNFEKHS